MKNIHKPKKLEAVSLQDYKNLLGLATMLARDIVSMYGDSVKYPQLKLHPHHKSSLEMAIKSISDSGILT